MVASLGHEGIEADRTYHKKKTKGLLLALAAIIGIAVSVEKTPDIEEWLSNHTFIDFGQSPGPEDISIHSPRSKFAKYFHGSSRR